MRRDVCPYCGWPLVIVTTPAGISQLHDFPVCRQWWSERKPGRVVNLAAPYLPVTISV